MPLRLIEMLIPEEKQTDVKNTLEESNLALDSWYDWVSEKQISVKILVTVEDSQKMLDKLDEEFSNFDEFRLILTPVEAILPRPDEAEEKEKEEKEKEKKGERSGISREELYENITDKSQLSTAYIALISLSAIVAAIGVLRDDIAVIIGAMVIAPMVGPNIGLSFATTLADPVLGKKSLKTNFLGIGLAFIISILLGLILKVDPNIPFILSRTQAGLPDIALALAAGAAGAVSFTRGVSTALIGVMVSIALLPTLVVSGLLFGSGNLILAGGAMLLFLINLTCINLTGVITFLIEGLKPKSWWKEKKAQKMTRLAMLIWISLLSLLAVAILFTF
ncbi:MAG: TIGR00341 family protein [Candidatus Hadarchaeota archaeon]